jgi:hypothetical protein
MAQYLTRPDGTIPPGVDVAALEAAGVLIVRPVEAPRVPGMVAVEGDPEQRDGVWWQTWRLEPVPPPEPPPVPRSVTPLQARRALRAAGLMPAVEAALAEADDDARDAWEYAIEVRRDDPLLAALAAQVGLTTAQVDDLFRDAAQR